MVAVTHRPGVLWVVLILLIAQWGCAHSLPIPPSEQARATLGTIGVVSGRFAPEAGLRTSAGGWAGGAGRGAAIGAGRTVGTAAEIGVHGRDLGGVLIIALGIALAPVGALVGSVVGGATAEPAATVEEAEAVLKNALAELKVQETMRDRVLQLARDQTRHRFILLSEQGPTALDEKVSYQSLASAGVDTALEVNVVSLGLEGPWSINPPVALFMTLRTRLVRVGDGIPIYEATFEYKGRARTFTEWAANNAQPFRDGLEDAYQSLAEKVVEELFLLYLPPE